MHDLSLSHSHDEPLKGITRNHFKISIIAFQVVKTSWKLKAESGSIVVVLQDVCDIRDHRRGCKYTETRRSAEDQCEILADDESIDNRVSSCIDGLRRGIITFMLFELF